MRSFPFVLCTIRAAAYVDEGRLLHHKNRGGLEHRDSNDDTGMIFENQA